MGWDFPGSPVVQILPSIAGHAGSIPGWGARPKHQNIKSEAICNKFNKDFKKMVHIQKKKKKKREREREYGKSDVMFKIRLQKGCGLCLGYALLHGPSVHAKGSYWPWCKLTKKKSMWEGTEGGLQPIASEEFELLTQQPVWLNSTNHAGQYGNWETEPCTPSDETTALDGCLTMPSGETWLRCTQETVPGAHPQKVWFCLCMSL